MSWELPALTLLSLSAVGLWGLGSPQPFHRKAFYILVSASAVLVDPRQVIARMYTSAHEAFLDYQLDALFAQHFKMALTLGAVFWLAPSFPITLSKFQVTVYSAAFCCDLRESSSTC